MEKEQEHKLENDNDSSEGITSENEKENSLNSEDKLDSIKDDEIEGSLESIPFIAEPVKKKRTRSSK